MTITAANVKLMAAERLTDYDDGGGMMSPQEVVDGVVNNLFPDISRLDRVYGRVSLRKCFVAVQSALAEMYYGAHAIIMQPPADSAVDVTMFATGSYADERVAAQSRVESYLAVSVESRWRLLTTHLAGQRALLLYSEVGAAAPAIGATLVVRRMTAAENGTLETEQYVRLSRVMGRETRAFAHESGGGVIWFNKDVLSIEIGSALRYDFPSEQPSYTDLSPGRTKVHETTVADAARYYGVSRLAADVASGALSVRVPSLFAQLVPSAQAEVPAIDISAAGDSSIVVPTHQLPTLSISAGPFSGATPKVIYTPCALVPRSVYLKNGQNVGASDDGFGHLAGPGFEASIDYGAGIITVTATFTGGTILGSARPGVRVTRAGCSNYMPVAAENRGYNWVMSLDPLPAPGSVYVDYMAQGTWYRLQDDGAGNLAGAETAYGSGTVIYATGSMIVTCGAMPDVGSAVIWGWGTQEDFQIEAPSLGRELAFALAHGAIDPGSLSLTVPTLAGDVTVYATAAGQLSAVGGGVTGRIDYASGAVRLQMTALPASNAVMTASYSCGASALTWSGVFASSMDIGATDIRPGSVRVTYTVAATGPSYYGMPGAVEQRTMSVIDDAAGNLRAVADGVVKGFVSYAAGTIAITGIENVSVAMPAIYPATITNPAMIGTYGS